MIRQNRRVTDTAASVYIYCRLSQDKTGEAIAVERQERECRELAEHKGLFVSRVFTDNDVSATSGKRRKSFEELLAIAHKGDIVIVWHTDRLVRLSRELERVLDAEVTVYAVTSGDIDLSTPAGRAVAKTVTAWAQYEGEQKALRQKSRLRELAEEGRAWWRNRPMGLNMDGTLHAEEAELIRNAYGWLLNGVPLREIARRWAGAGYRLLNGREPAGGDVRRVLNSPRTAGLREYRPIVGMKDGHKVYGEAEIVGRGQWEPVVDEETYYAAHALLSDPSRRNGESRHGRKPTYLLSALPAVTCGICGTTLKAGGRSPQTGVPRYTCAGNRCLYIAQPWLDAMVLAWTQLLLPFHREAAVRFGVGPDSERLAELERTIAGADAKLDDLAERYAADRLDLDDYERLSAPVRKRLERAEVDRAALGVAEVLDDATKRLLGLSASELDDLGHGEWRALISQVLTASPMPRGKGNYRLRLSNVLIAPKRAVPTESLADLAALLSPVAEQLGADGVPRSELISNLSIRWASRTEVGPGRPKQ